MRAAHALLLSLSLSLLVAPPADARNKKARKEKAPAPAFLQALTPDHGQLLVFYDVARHADAALASDTARRLGELLKRDDPEATTPDDLRAELEGARGSVPTEAVLGVTPAGVALVGDIARVVLLGELIRGATTAGDPAAAAALQAELVAALKGLRLAGHTAYARFADGTTPSMALVALSGALGGAARDVDGMKATFEERAVGLQVPLGAVVDVDTAQSILRELGAAPADAPAPMELIDALQGVRVEAWLERSGEDGLRFTLGPRPSLRARGLKAKKLGRTFGAAPEDQMWLRWDIEPIAEQLRAFGALWQRWAGTPAGQAAARTHAELANNAAGVDRWLRTATGSGDLRAWTSGGGIELAGFDAPPPPAAPLEGSELARFLPAAAQMIVADQHASMADVLLDTVSSLTELDLPQEVLAELQATMDARAEAMFRPGVALLSGWGDTVRSVEILGRDGGEVERYAATHLPNYGLVVIAALAPDQDGVSLVGATVRGLAAMLCEGVANPLPADAPVFEARDLGLGVETSVLGWGWLGRCTGGEVQVTIEGDLQLHTFQIGGHLVVSSSRAMSERVLAAYGGSGRRAALPTAPPKSRLTSYTVIPGALVAGWLQMGADWLAAFDADDDDADDLRLAADAFRLVGALKIVSGTGKRGARLTTGSLTFR